MNILGSVDVEVRAQLDLFDRALDGAETRSGAFERNATRSFDHVARASEQAGRAVSDSMSSAGRASDQAGKAMTGAATEASQATQALTRTFSQAEGAAAGLSSAEKRLARDQKDAERTARALTEANEGRTASVVAEVAAHEGLTAAMETEAEQEARLTAMVRSSISAYQERRAAVEEAAEAEVEAVQMLGNAWGGIELDELIAPPVKEATDEMAKLDAEVEKLTRSLDPLYAAQRKYDDEVDRAHHLLSRGAITQDTFNRAVQKAQGDLSRATREIENNGRSAERGLRRLGTSFTTFGSQAAAGNLSARNMATGIRQVAISATLLGGPLGIAVGLIAGMTVAAAAGAVVWYRYDAAVHQAELSLYGLGRSAGITSGEFMEMASESARAANITQRAAREAQATFLQMGISNRQVLTELTRLSRDYAAVTGQEFAAANAELGRSFADPIRGVETLDDKLGLLDAETRAYIVSLVRQNQLTEAQTVLLRALQGEIAGASNEVTGLAAAWRDVTTWASNAFSAMGKALAVDAGGGTTQDRLEVLRGRRDSRLGQVGRRIFGGGDNLPIDQEIRRLEAIQATERATAAAAAAEQERRRISREGAAAAADLLPWERQRAQVNSQIADIERARAAGLMNEAEATRALRAARVQLTQIDERASRSGARAGRTNNRGAQLAREAESMEVNARASLELAEAYLESSAAAFEAEASRQALTQATRRGIDVEAQIRRQMALNVAQAVASASQQAAASQATADAQRQVNEQVAAGTMTLRQAEEWLQEEATTRDLNNLLLVAEGEAREILTRVLDRQRGALRQSNEELARMEALRQTDQVNQTIEMMELELTLIGKTNQERRVAIAQLQAMQQLREMGVDPTSVEGAAFLGANAGAADLEGRLEVGEWMDESTRRIREQIQAFQDEAAVIGMTFREVERFRMEQQLLQEAQSRGIELTDEHRAAIAGLADAYADAAEQSRLMNEHMRALEEASNFAAESFAGFFDELVWGSGSAEDALRSLVRGLGQAMFQAFALGQGPLAGILGTANTGKMGGGSGGVLSGLGRSIFSRFISAPVAHSGLKPYGAAASSRQMPVAAFLGAPRLHDGLFRSDEFPAILQRGETVNPKGSRQGGGNVFITVNTPDADSFRRNDRQLGRELRQRFRL